MPKLYNLARMTTATTGTINAAGTLTLGTAVSGCLSFATAGALNGDILSFGITDGVGAEVGRATYGTAAGGTTLVIGTILNSTNGANAINLSGTAQVYITPVAQDISIGYPCNGRLTLETGVAVSTADQADKTTLYFTPYMGNQIAIFDGATWSILTFAELSLDISGYTASKPYDIWIYNNSGSATLDSTVWTSGSVRATALALQDGVYCKTGTLTRRYLGTIYMDAASKCQDTANKRFVWNYYNRVLRAVKTNNTTTSWTYTTHAWREYNNGTGQVSGEFIVGVLEDGYIPSFTAYLSNSGGGYYDIALVYDAVNGSNILNQIEYNANIQNPSNPVGLLTYFPIGYHYVTLVEDAIVGSTVYGVLAVVPALGGQIVSMF
jgi:hypothetical protein